jgi:LuxR family maltose regulon positive regulatory protein
MPRPGRGSAGELARARVVIAEVDSSATATERAWGAGAGAAVALLRLAEARADSIERGHPAAVPRLRRALELAEAWGRPPVLVEALTSMAEAQWAVGERGAGRSCLDRARQAASSGAAGQLATGRLTTVEGRIGRQAGDPAHRRGLLVEQLTDRELAILRALRGPMSAREIGAELYLSINTVKYYAKSLYRKLGVTSRADAVARGHDLGLI